MKENLVHPMGGAMLWEIAICGTIVMHQKTVTGVLKKIVPGLGITGSKRMLCAGEENTCSIYKHWLGEDSNIIKEQVSCFNATIIFF